MRRSILSARLECPLNATRETIAQLLSSERDSVSQANGVVVLRFHTPFRQDFQVIRRLFIRRCYPIGFFCFRLVFRFHIIFSGDVRDSVKLWRVFVFRGGKRRWSHDRWWRNNGCAFVLVDVRCIVRVEDRWGLVVRRRGKVDDGCRLALCAKLRHCVLVDGRSLLRLVTGVRQQRLQIRLEFGRQSWRLRKPHTERLVSKKVVVTTTVPIRLHFDSTAIRHHFDRATTIRRPTYTKDQDILHCICRLKK